MHGWIRDVVNVQRQRPDGNANHRFGMVEELDRLDVQRKVLVSFVEEEMNGVLR